MFSEICNSPGLFYVPVGIGLWITKEVMVRDPMAELA
jgi:hypothetical protein